MNFHKEPLAKFFFFLKMLAIPNVTYIGLRVQMFEIHFTEESTSSLIALYILIIYSATFDCFEFSDSKECSFDWSSCSEFLYFGIFLVGKFHT